MPRSKKKRNNKKAVPLYLGIAFFLFILLALSVFIVLRSYKGFVPEHSDFGPVVHTTEKAPKAVGGTKRVLCFVIDDVGQSWDQAQPFLAFPGPLTLAVIPYLPKSRELALEAATKGKLVLLHQPMQALGGQDPGVGALYLSDSEAQIRFKLNEALASLSVVKGINNHMGSAFTENEEKMKIVLSVVKEHSLFFFDSKTTPRSAVKKAGESLGMKIQERDVFLDNEKSREYILQAIEEGKKTSQEKGRAVMIGHVWSSDLAQILMEVYPTLLEEGYTLEDLSHFLQADGSDENSGD